MTFDPSTIIAAILGTPRAQPPSFVPDQAKRAAAMQQRVHQEFRLPPQRRHARPRAAPAHAASRGMLPAMRHARGGLPVSKPLSEVAMTISKLDQASYARCPALQHIAAHNDRIAATAQAKLAAEQAAKEARVERGAAAREKRRRNGRRQPKRRPLPQQSKPKQKRTNSGFRMRSGQWQGIISKDINA